MRAKALLTAKRHDGVPGLYLAFQNGRAAALETFVEQVLASNLPSDDKVNLLATERGDRLYGLFIAVQKGR